MKKRKDEKLRGDKLRDLILFVYLNNKYGGEKIKLSRLKEKLGYSTGGLYSALDESGYFESRGEEIRLTEKGEAYLRKHILPQYTVFYPIGNFLIILGLVLLLQWYLWTYLQTPMIFQWYSALMIIAGGIILRVFFMRLVYWVMVHRKEGK
ncbi:MAG: hypothetical protein QXP16_01860 [Candidatus Bathyarchaeia archaeon]